MEREHRRRLCNCSKATERRGVFGMFTPKNASRCEVAYLALGGGSAGRRGADVVWFGFRPWQLSLSLAPRHLGYENSHLRRRYALPRRSSFTCGDAKRNGGRSIGFAWLGEACQWASQRETGRRPVGVGGARGDLDRRSCVIEFERFLTG